MVWAHYQEYLNNFRETVNSASLLCLWVFELSSNIIKFCIYRIASIYTELEYISEFLKDTENNTTAE